MSLKNYETVFILTPVLSDSQMKDTAEKFKKLLVDNGAKIVNEESWGLKKLAYTIQHKTTGFYHLLEFEGATTLVNTLELEYRRDERVMRFLTTALDHDSVEYNKKRRKGDFNLTKKAAAEKEVA